MRKRDSTQPCMHAMKNSVEEHRSGNGSSHPLSLSPSFSLVKFASREYMISIG